MIITSTTRQYITNPLTLSTDLETLNIAEAIIDEYLPVMISGSVYSKTVVEEVITTVDFAGGLVVLPTDLSRVKNYYQYLAVEILDGINAGLILPVVSSEDNNLNVAVDNLVNDTGVTCKIYQPGKLPRKFDLKMGVTKSIPAEVRQAAALQAKYLLENSEILTSQTFKSESESTGSYSYTLGGVGDGDMVIMPHAVKKLLDGLNMYQFI